MDDCDIVAAIAAGDADGIARAYDKYAKSVYGYCHWMVPQPGDAAVALQDTFIIAAARVGVLHDPRRLRPWLYAVARCECRRWLDRDPAAPAAPAAARIPAVPSGLTSGQGDDALDPVEREAAELNLRHHLAGSDLAAVLGVSRGQAHALVARARGRLEGSATAPQERTDRPARPTALPRVLRDEVLRLCTEDAPDAVAYREWVIRRGGQFGPGGFPRPAVRPRRMFAVAGAAAAAAAVIAVASTGIVTALTLSGPNPPRSLDAARAGGGPAAASARAGRDDTLPRIATAAASSGVTASAAPIPTQAAAGAGGRPQTPVPTVSLVTTVPAWTGSAGPGPSASPSPSPSPTAPPDAPSPTPSPDLQWPPPSSPPSTGFP